MVALIVGSRVRIVLADPGETSRYSSLVRLMKPAMGPRLNSVPSYLLSVIRVHVREAAIDCGKTSKAVYSEGLGDKGTSGMCIGEWWLSFKVWDMFDI
jgi:hypothetical protein